MALLAPRQRSPPAAAELVVDAGRDHLDVAAVASELVIGRKTHSASIWKSKGLIGKPNIVVLNSSRPVAPEGVLSARTHRPTPIAVASGNGSRRAVDVDCRII